MGAAGAATGPAARFPDHFTHPNFAERLFAGLHCRHEQEVVRWPASRPGATATALSGAELLARVVAWQRALEAAGPLPAGTPVLLAHPGSPELVAALLAVLGLGAVPVLPPAGATARQLLALVRAERISRVATTPRWRRRGGWLARLLGGRLLSAPPTTAADTTSGEALSRPELRAVSLAQPALVSHSSGSGRPTAVRRSHQVRTRRCGRSFRRGPGSATCPFSPTLCCTTWPWVRLACYPTCRAAAWRRWSRPACWPSWLPGRCKR